jgi:hypothetical protein
MATSPRVRPFAERIPRLRQWHVIWFLWGVLLGWFVWGGPAPDSPPYTGRGAENAFVGFANAALRRNPYACDLLTPAAAAELIQALGDDTPVPAGPRAIERCMDRLPHVPVGRIQAFLPEGPLGSLYDGFSRDSDETRATISFGSYTATLETTPAFGWRITQLHRSGSAGQAP